MKVSTKLLEIGNSIVSFFHVKALVKPLYYFFYKNRVIHRQQKLFKKNSKEALSLFDSCLKTHQIPYVLAFGTLLGGIREHGFIKHDFDIDTMIWNEDYRDDISNILAEKGINLIHTFLIDDGATGREESYEFKGVQIDIFYLYTSAGEFPYTCDFLARDCISFEACMKKYGSVLPRKIELPVSRNTKYIDFEGISLPVPENAEEILSFRYGKDYMIPNPKWNVQSYNKHIIEWNEKKGMFLNFVELGKQIR
jgi:hypothetical protein